MTYMNELPLAVELIEGWEEDEGTNWDDMREWDVEDFQLRYQISEGTATILWYYMREQQDIQYDMYGVEDEKAPLVLEMIQESLHQSLDGWTEEEKLVIRAYLCDIAYSANLAHKDRQK